jgi:hypothetical protein
MARGRPGGNPGLKKFQFSAAGDEPLNVALRVKIAPSMDEKLRKLPNKAEFVREAIARALEELEQ